MYQVYSFGAGATNWNCGQQNTTQAPPQTNKQDKNNASRMYTFAIYIYIYTCVYTHFYIVIRRSSRLVRGWCDKVRGRRLTTFHSTCVAPFHYAAQGPMTCTRYAADARTTQASNKVKNTKTNTNPLSFWNIIATNICAQIYTHIYTHSYTQNYTHNYTHLRTHLHTSTHIITHRIAHVITYIYAHIYTHIYTHSYTQNYTRNYTRLRTHLHT